MRLLGALTAISIVSASAVFAADSLYELAIGDPARKDKKAELQVDAITDTRDAADLQRVLQDEVVPMYYERDVDGLPGQWIKRMMNSISTLAWRFSAHRMVADYCDLAYFPMGASNLVNTD